MAETNVETLRLWSHILLWVLIVLPAVAAGARFYVERAEKRIVSRNNAAQIQSLREAQMAAAAMAEMNAAEVARLKVISAESKQRLESTAHVATQADTRSAKLETAAQPRVLTESQQKKLLASLSQLPKADISVQVIVQDSEADQFANQVENVFRQAGFPTEHGAAVMSSEPTMGLQMTLNPNAVPRCASGLQQAFKAVGFELVTTPNESQTAASVVITVGKKPR